MEVRRARYLKLLHDGECDNDVVKVVTGMRRCGKSVLLKQYQQDLIDNNRPSDRIFRINFETLQGQEIADKAALNEWIGSHIPPNDQTFLMLDEIQNVEGWEMSVAALCTMERCDVYITGSNSKMLSSDLATHISGRYVEIDVLPLSLAEVMECRGISDPENALADVLVHGSLPGLDTSRGEEYATQYLDGVFNTVLVKDVLRILHMDRADVLVDIARFLYSNIGNITNMARIAEVVGISEPTVKRYVNALVDARLFYYAECYDIVERKILKTRGKYYATDLGMRRSVLGGAAGTDTSRPLENLVYLELRRRGYKVRIGSYRDAEVDFTAFKGDQVHYYQVTQTMLSEETRMRELRPLESIRDNYRKTVLTMDRIGLGSEKGIDIANVVEWLSGGS